MDAPLLINIEFGGDLGACIAVQVKNNGSEFFPAPNTLTIGSGVHLIIRDPETKKEKLLYWGESPFGGGTDMVVNGLAAGKGLEATIPLTGEEVGFELRGGEDALQPNKSYELSVGYGYIKGAQPSAGFIPPRDQNSDFPMQRVVGLQLNTDKDLNFAIVTTTNTRTEFLAQPSSFSSSGTGEIVTTIPVNIKSRINIANIPVRPAEALANESEIYFFGVGFLVLILLTILGFYLKRRKIMNRFR